MQAADRELELAHRQERARELLAGLFTRWGYRRIRTPMWEEAPQPPPGMPDTGLCRFVDPAGRVLALRADHTAAVARWAAPRYGPGSSPWRLYYIDPVFRRDPRDGQFTARLQAGVELIGAAQPWGDVEVIALLLEALDELGLADARVAVGHTGLLWQLLESRGLSPEQRERACALLAGRDLAGLRRFLEEALPGERAAELHSLLAGGLSPAAAARVVEHLTGDAAAAFRQVLEAVERLAPPGRVRVEFGLARDLGYYTGAVFEAYAGGGRVAAGGRYDTLLERYGGCGPATGFAFDLEEVAASLPDAPAAAPVDYLVAGRDPGTLWREASRLRRRGCSAVVAPGLPHEEAARAAARAQGCRRVLWLDGEHRSLRMAGDAVAEPAGDGAVQAIH